MPGSISVRAIGRRRRAVWPAKSGTAARTQITSVSDTAAINQNTPRQSIRLPSHAPAGTPRHSASGWPAPTTARARPCWRVATMRRA
ncbi:Uncharacterised protein [Achromobacter ruhlandii]|nr:Uncharacterised protein [Achromobacter ruhlandii]